ncbi:glycosyltransferase family 4 protein [Methanobacterium sp.]|uniref:glycosyltransferase family 4 protein n=1 Tax=Methanobacterium sp. TaxID=2164 RepID=UPI003C73FBA8
MMDNHKILLHFHGIFYPNTYYILRSIPAQIPVIAQSHASSPTLIRALFDKTPLMFLELFESLIQKNYFKKVDQFFCLSKLEKKEFSKYGSAIIQPMGIDFNKFKPIKKEIALKKIGLENKNYILYVGRIDEVKGIKYLIKGFKDIIHNNNVNLIIAGEGPYKPEIVSLIENLGISERVEFLGFVKNENLPYLYNVADVTVSPSLWEAYPVVPMESLACKIPLITTNVGAIPEITDHFKGGYQIVPMHDSNTISCALKEVISEKISKSDIDRENGQKYHDWDSIIKNTVAVYDKLYGEYYG